jgi:hypothetical protein
VEQFKSFGTTLTKQYSIQGVKERLSPIGAESFALQFSIQKLQG